MSADLLRRAAAKLREHAEAIGSSSPWKVVYFGDRGYPQRVVDDRSTLLCQTYEGRRDESPVRVPAVVPSYIALVHPPVALALADWLDDAAAWWDKEVRFAERVVTFPGGKAPEDWPASRFVHALAVARAVLREPGDTP